MENVVRDNVRSGFEYGNWFELIPGKYIGNIGFLLWIAVVGVMEYYICSVSGD